MAGHINPSMVVVDTTIYRDIYNWLTQTEVRDGPETEVYQRYHSDPQEYIKFCNQAKHTNWYQSSTKQTCAIPAYQRKFPDVCESGWTFSSQD